MNLLSGTRFRAASWTASDVERLNEFLHSELGERLLRRLEATVPRASDPSSIAVSAEAKLSLIAGSERMLIELMRLSEAVSADEIAVAAPPEASGPAPITGYPSLEGNAGWPKELQLPTSHS